MGLNRMMMKNGVKVEDGSKKWSYSEADNKTITFTVPLGVKRIKVFAEVDSVDEEGDSLEVYIENILNHKKWGYGYSEMEGLRYYHHDIDSIVGVTSNKTYTLHFDCYFTSGVTFSWGKAINDMTPTVEDY